jgi:hypothetical protein
MDKMAMAEYLAQARIAARDGDLNALTAAFHALDNGGVFRTLDEFTEYAEPEEILDAARKALRDVPARKDPAEWGDLTGYQTVGEYAREISGGNLDVADRKAMSRLGKRAFGLD